jgi:hypothetical protein
MRKLFSGFVICMIIILTCIPASAREVKVRIEASLPDAVKLLERLNANGKNRNLSFKLAEDQYEFRIATASEGWSSSDVLLGSAGADASAAILTPDCKLLFIVSRSGRMTQGGALNAVSKEVVKKLARYLEAQGTN